MFYVFCFYNYTKYEVAKKSSQKKKKKKPKTNIQPLKFGVTSKLDISTFKTFPAKYYNKYEFGSKHV